MAKEMKRYIFYGSPFRSKAKTEWKKNNQGESVEVSKVVSPFVAMEFENMKKATRYLEKNNWNLLYEKDGDRVRFVVMSVEEL